MATENEKKIELKIGKSGLLIVITGMTALLGAAFLFGVDVGQNIDVYPEKIASLPQRALALVWRPARIKMAQQSASQGNAGQNKSTVVQESQAAPEEGNIDLTYYKTLTSKKGLSKADSFLEKQPVVATSKIEEDAKTGKFLIETPTQTVNKKEDVKETSKPKESAKEKETIKVKDTVKEKDSVKSKETVKLKEMPKVETGTLETQPNKQKFIIQVASLKDKSKAYEINKKISSLGFQSKIVKTQIKDKGILFRVIASDFNDKNQAQQAMKKISAKTGTNCIIKKIDTKIN